MRFASNHRDHPYFKQMVYKGIELFAKIHILGHSQYNNTKVNFVGSVAYFFADILQEVAKDLGFEIGKIIRKPITALADYHLKFQNSKSQYEKR
jgi:glucosamine kinase